jgi:hypothetical protein
LAKTSVTSWNQAQSNCKALPGFHLVTITSQAEQDAVHQLAGSTDEYWIGLSEGLSAYQQKQLSNLDWVTAPLEHFDSTTSYSNWDQASNPKEPNWIGDYVKLHANGGWALEQVSKMHWAVCERDY